MLSIQEVRRDEGELIKCVECSWVHVTFNEQFKAMCSKCGGTEWNAALPSDYPPDALFSCVDDSKLEEVANNG